MNLKKVFDEDSTRLFLDLESDWSILNQEQHCLMLIGWNWSCDLMRIKDQNPNQIDPTQNVGLVQMKMTLMVAVMTLLMTSQLMAS